MQFRQFLFPDGKEIDVFITVPQDVEDMADALKKEGWRFEMEKLPNDGMVRMDCSNDEEQLANAVVENGPSIPKTVEELVRRAYSRLIHGLQQEG